MPRSLYADYDADALAESVVSCLNEVEPLSPSINLVIPLSWCFFHVLERPAQRNADQALSFAFENYLPVSLEELTCTFVPMATNRVLALGVPTAQTQRLIAAVEQRDVEIAHLVVDVVSLIASSAKQESNQCTIVIDSSSARFGAFGSKESVPLVGFITASNEPGAETTLDHQLKQRGIESLDPWRILNLDEATNAKGIQSFSPKEQASFVSGEAAVEIIAQSARLSHAGDLRTGALASPGRWNAVIRLARHCTLLLAASLAIAVVGLHTRLRVTDAQLQQVLAEQSEVYGQVFSQQSAPTGAAMRLASERIRMEALTRKQATKTDSHGAPLDVLREFVAQLPADVRITLQEARIDDKQMALRGLTAEHRDAERIAESLHKLPGVDVRPPRTRRLETGGVEFSIAATPTAHRQQ